jgi:hypothetical protein
LTDQLDQHRIAAQLLTHGFSDHGQDFVGNGSAHVIECSLGAFVEVGVERELPALNATQWVVLWTIVGVRDCRDRSC